MAKVVAGSCWCLPADRWQNRQTSQQATDFKGFQHFKSVSATSQAIHQQRSKAAGNMYDLHVHTLNRPKSRSDPQGKSKNSVASSMVLRNKKLRGWVVHGAVRLA
jgi:hypothetical protein